MRILFFQDENGLLKRLCHSRPFGIDLLNGLAQQASLEQAPCHLLIPRQWTQDNPQLNALDCFTYETRMWQIPELVGQSDSEDLCILNGNVLLHIDQERLASVLESFAWDIVTIRVNPDLQASKEILKLTPQANVVGFRRFYSPSIEPAHSPSHWPDMLIIKRDTWNTVFADGVFPLDYEQFRSRIDTRQCRLTHLRAGGRRLKMDDEAAVLDCLDGYHPAGSEMTKSPQGAVGLVLTGSHVTIEPGVKLIGPVALSDHVHIESGAVIRRSILAEGVRVQKDQVINNRILFNDMTPEQIAHPAVYITSNDQLDRFQTEYKSWSLWSYARFGKRLFDIIASSIVLMLLIPVFAVVSVVLKLTSPGPLFYKARRQGLHGKDFDCLKFRSMMVAADSIQERLRVVNQVDGPQFKMENDPRITSVGKFLRDTYIDELPQFINVLLGQMSIVGPRPSPENENDSSPAWRDARLSVRPGITGLWQVLRTRKEGADFQEWVYYDTRYVRKLSFRTDLWICWKTAMKLIHSFLGQFG